MFAGGKLSNSNCLAHFIEVCILFVFVIVEWAFQLSLFKKMSPWCGKGGPFSMATYYILLFVWLFNLIAVCTLIANIIIYFVAFYILDKDGKDTSKLKSAMNILAKVSYGFLITSSVFGIIISIIIILPDMGIYSEMEEENTTYTIGYENKYTKVFLDKVINNQICSLVFFEVAHKYGKDLYENPPIVVTDETDQVKVQVWIWLNMDSFRINFKPFCNGTLIPMFVLCFIIMVYGSVAKCSFDNNAKDPVSNEPNAQQKGQQQQQQYPNQQGYPPNQPGMYPNQQGYPPNQPGMYPQQGYPPNQPGMYPNQQGYPPNQPGMYPQQGYPPNQPGMYPNQQGYPPNQPGMYPNQQGYPPNQPAGYPQNQPGANPNPNQQAAATPNQTDTNQQASENEDTDEGKPNELIL